MKLKEITDEELYFGHTGCSGCGTTLMARQILKILGKKCIFVEPAGCLLAVTCFYPQVALKVPLLPTAFPATASTASGVSAALKVKGREDIKVVAIGGDGATSDIGFAALSGLFERGDNVMYICNDNEAYMNTGVQRSSLTPWGCKTTTTPGGKNKFLEDKPKKNIMGIAAAHNIPYAATASISHWSDFFEKLEKAHNVKGPSYLQVFCPCPTGWGISTDETVEIARLAVQTGVFPLYEIENGKYRITQKITKMKPVYDYISKQARFEALSKDDVKYIEKLRDKQWEEINRMVDCTN